MNSAVVLPEGYYPVKRIDFNGQSGVFLSEDRRWLEEHYLYQETPILFANKRNTQLYPGKVIIHSETGINYKFEKLFDGNQTVIILKIFQGTEICIKVPYFYVALFNEKGRSLYGYVYRDLQSGKWFLLHKPTRSSSRNVEVVRILTQQIRYNYISVFESYPEKKTQKKNLVTPKISPTVHLPEGYYPISCFCRDGSWKGESPKSRNYLKYDEFYKIQNGLLFSINKEDLHGNSGICVVKVDLPWEEDGDFWKEKVLEKSDLPKDYNIVPFVKESFYQGYRDGKAIYVKESVFLVSKKGESVYVFEATPVEGGLGLIQSARKEIQYRYDAHLEKLVHLPNGVNIDGGETLHYTENLIPWNFSIENYQQLTSGDTIMLYTGENEVGFPCWEKVTSENHSFSNSNFYALSRKWDIYIQSLIKL
jgi:hypothetical protein